MADGEIHRLMGLRRSEMESYKYVQRIFDKSSKAVQWGKRESIQQMMWENGHTYAKKINF